MDLLALVATLCVMGAVIAVLMAFYQASASPRLSMERRLGTMLGSEGSYEAALGDINGLRQRRVGRVPIISSLLQGRSWTTEMSDQLELADIRLTVSEFVAVRILVALFAATVPATQLGGTPLGIGAALVAAFVGFKLPLLFVSFARKRRVSKLDKQLLEMLSLVANSLKAGFGLMQSLELSSRQLEHPIATEIRRLLYDINVGATTESALQALAKRSGSPDFDIVVTAILVQQSTGGNLAEILDTVGHTMRERIRIRGEIKTLTSQQMLTGLIIGGLPFAMAGAFMVLSPDYMQPLFTTTAGRLMLIGAGMLELFGILLIKKILSIEV